jgi:DNA-binding beta-propeller fold protein YncE
VQEIFEKANNGAVLGAFVQSLTFHDDKAYIVVNGANQIVVADAATFEFLDTISGLASPRFMTVTAPNIAYVSQWGADGVTGSVAKIDLNNNRLMQTIPTGHAGPEKMLQTSFDVLYIANSGGFGVDSTITMLNLATDQVLNTFPAAGKNPSTVISNGRLWGLCSGYFADTTASGNGALGDFGPSVFKTTVPKYAGDLILAPDGKTLYFFGGDAVHAFENNNALRKLFDQPTYGLALQPSTGHLICTDPKNFTGNGEAVLRKVDGTIISRFPTGVAPGEVIVVE